MKTGCNLEVHALRDASRLEPLIALISVISVRLFQLKLIGRNQPAAKANSHVPSSWLRALKLARPRIKLTGMSVYQFFREIAKLDGFLGRKHDGEPGWQTIWRGYQKLQSLLEAMKIVRAT
jgi:Transposase Tn5 dimerisation domain